MDSKKSFSHVDSLGNPTMVDVGNKEVTARVATAESVVVLNHEITEQLSSIKKDRAQKKRITNGIRPK